MMKKVLITIIFFKSLNLPLKLVFVPIAKDCSGYRVGASKKLLAREPVPAKLNISK